MHLELDLEAFKKILLLNNYKKIIVFLPSGAKKFAFMLKEAASAAGVEVIFSLTPHYGGCDIPYWLVKAVKADAAVAVGHNLPRFLKPPFPVHFVDLQLIDLEGFFLPPHRRIGVVFALNYRKTFEAYVEFLKTSGKEVVIPKGYGPFCKLPGQITGCDIVAAEEIASNVDAFVVVAGGTFHAKAVAALGKPTYTYKGQEVRHQQRNPLPLILKAKKVALLYSLKPGQRFHWAKGLKKKLEEIGKEVIEAYGDEITTEAANFQADLYIINGCPRIVEDFAASGFTALPAKEVLRHI